ncbi:beta-N-acetylhexosaminidase [Photobacterium sagamiensis]|uniref:beta-N-acetylhexosaminidase n=1 Tax=Photobacterium sagamiensis TaxID=2910241 RepID=UPI003D0ECA68
MSYRVDFTVISKAEHEPRFALTLHNLSDQPVEEWSLHFVINRWIEPTSVLNGQVKQLGSYCVITSEALPLLASNSHFYTEFTMATAPFTLHDDGIHEAFLVANTTEGFIKPLPVEVTCVDLGQPAIERFNTKLPPAKALNIIPMPTSVTPLNGRFKLTQSTAIASPNALASGAARWLQEELTDLLHDDFPIHRDGNIHYQAHPEMAEGAYRLLIEQNNIWLQASSKSGFTHATSSLLQLLPANPEHHAVAAYSIPMVDINDRPHYQYRGMMLDCARHFHSIKRIKHLIDQLARYKFNTFHWHLTDDEGWRIEIDAYPELTRIGAWRGPNEVLLPQFTTINRRYGGYYSKQDAKELIAYASERGITIIPEIDIPGHCRAAIKSLPDLLVDPEDKSQYLSIQNYPDNVLSPALKGTYTFISNVLTEICELFPAPFVHIGADEVPAGVWTDSEACQNLMAQHGYQDPKDLQGHLLRFAEELLQANGKQMMGWEEATDGDKVSKQTTIFSWRNENAGLVCAQQGYDVVMQPAQFTYLDLAQGYSADEPGADWAGKLPLDDVYQYRPLAELAPDDPAHQRIIGIQTALWCELVNNQSRFEYMIYPRLLAISEICWTNPQQRNWDDFKARLNGQLKYLDKAGINYRHCE